MQVLLKYAKWVPSIVVMVAIFWLSSIKGSTINNAGLGDDSLHKAGHFIMFFVLAVTNFIATKSISKSVGFTVLYAFSDEYHQNFTSGRSASFNDIFVDSLAALVGGVLSWRLYPVLLKIQKILQKK